MKAAALLIPDAVQPSTTDPEGRLTMSTTSITSTVSTPAHAVAADVGTRRGWAWSGLAAGMCGLALFVVAPMAADHPDSAMADNAVMVGHLDGVAWVVWVTQVLTVLAAGLLVVFGAGLRRRLAEQGRSARCCRAWRCPGSC